MAFDPEQTAEKLIHMKADVQGWQGRTVRLNDGKVALATCTYNFSQDEETKSEMARRLAALWNLAIGVPTSEIERFVEAGVRIKARS